VPYTGGTLRVAVVASPGPQRCPVCRSTRIRLLATVALRRYWRCASCEAAFLDPVDYLPRHAEYAHYRRHQNHPHEPRYRRFLSRLATPLLERLPPRSEGLDYGCGPGPALAAMLEEAGHRVSLYDPLFFPDATSLRRQYDFITCTEVVEHFHHPAAEFERLAGLVRPGGRVALMTSFCPDDAAFPDWHYLRDPTHVVFYRKSTLRLLAAVRGLSLCCPVENVVLMQKPTEPQA
jgi:SAM-dependent methyltransferase